MKPKNVDEYVKSLAPEQAKIVSTLRALIRKAAPQAQESFKWAQPVYEANGPFAYIKAFKMNVNFGFWRGDNQPIGNFVGPNSDLLRTSSSAAGFRLWFAQATGLALQLGCES